MEKFKECWYWLFFKGLVEFSRESVSDFINLGLFCPHFIQICQRFINLADLFSKNQHFVLLILRIGFLVSISSLVLIFFCLSACFVCSLFLFFWEFEM
jgi:hypothetical protein